MPACSSLKIAYHSGPASRSITATAPLVSPVPYMDQAESSVAVRSVIGPRIDSARLRRAAAYCLCLSAATPSTSSATRSFLLACAMRSAYLTASSMSPPTSSDRKGGSSKSPFFGSYLGVAGGEIAARGRQTGKVRRARRLGGKLDRRRHQECSKRGANNAPGEARRNHGQCSNEADGRGLHANRRVWAENGLFAPPPQERWPRHLSVRLKASMWQHRGHNTGQPSHVLIIRPAAALGRNPGDVLIRVLDVAGFAVDAILRVDDKFRRTRLLNPFIDPGRTKA